MPLGHNINDGRRTQDIKINQDVSFDTMLLKPKTLKGLYNAGFFKPSPIQLHAIPLGKCGFDLMLEAKSGTGKTAVFAIIALEKIDLQKGLQVVMITPTREIANQIHNVCKEIGSKYEGLQVEVVMGGLPVQDDIEKFKKSVHIVVGTPGRLSHLIKDKFIDTSTVRMLVLDEADKLMDRSYQSDVKYIHTTLPLYKQIIMSSATYPAGSKTLIQEYVHNAQHICPDTNNVLLGIEQKVTIVKFNKNVVRQTQNKFTELLKILSNKEFKQGLIFCNYQARVGEIHKMLSKEKWPAEQLFGQQEQTNRLDALKTLQEYKCRLLVSTDLAARGIDASNVDLVINFEPPYEWQTYLHRIGRAGRFGSYGTAITILSEDVEENKFKILLESIKHPFELSYLWTNEKFSIKLDENVIEQCLTAEYDNHSACQKNVSIDDSAKKLWAALKADLKLQRPFEKFNGHRMDLNEIDANCEIEIFNDLMSSFDCYEINISEDNEFDKIELLKAIPIDERNHDSSKFCRNINNNCLLSLGNSDSYDGKEKEKELVEGSKKNSVNHENLIEPVNIKQDIENIIAPVDNIVSDPCAKDNENIAGHLKCIVTINNENAREKQKQLVESSKKNSVNQENLIEPVNIKQDIENIIAPVDNIVSDPCAKDNENIAGHLKCIVTINNENAREKQKQLVESSKKNSVNQENLIEPVNIKQDIENISVPVENKVSGPRAKDNENIAGCSEFLVSIDNETAREKEKQLVERIEKNSVHKENLIKPVNIKQNIENICIPLKNNISGPGAKYNENIAGHSEFLVSSNNGNAQFVKRDLRFERETSSKTLEELDLPTSFSSSKWSYNPHNKINIYNKNPNAELYKKSTHNQRYKKPTKSNWRKNKVEEESRINIQSCDAKESFRKFKNSDRLPKYQSNDNVNACNGQRGINHIEHKENYVNWYNSLKLRMKQIECFVYINELNKL